MEYVVKNIIDGNNFKFEKIKIVYSNLSKESYKQSLKIQSFLKEKMLSSDLEDLDSLDLNCNFVIVVGGDGSILKASRFYAQMGIPVFGVNLGRLGFLAQVKPQALYRALERIINGQFVVENRMMLSCDIEGMTALNDIVIKGSNMTRTSRLYIYINDRIVCDYLADGVIISTPTGSTAYSLSAGGPVVSPKVEAFSIVPICPHTLTARPVIIPACETITVLTCENCTKLNVSFDGQKMVNLDYNRSITIKKSNQFAKLVLLKDKQNDFYSVLRDKLNWGVAPKA